MPRQLLGVLFLLLLFGCKKEVKEVKEEKEKLFLEMRWFRKTEFNTTKQETYSQRASAHFNEHYMIQVGTRYYAVDPGEVRYGDFLLRPTTTQFLNIASHENRTGFILSFEAGKPWVVTGKPGSVPPFSTTGLPIPSLILKNMDTLSLLREGSSFTLNWDNTVPSDTMMIVLGHERSKVYNVSGNRSSFTFPASDIANQISLNGPAKTYIYLIGTRTKEMVVEGTPVQLSSVATRQIQIQTLR